MRQCTLSRKWRFFALLGSLGALPLGACAPADEVLPVPFEATIVDADDALRYRVGYFLRSQQPLGRGLNLELNLATGCLVPRTEAVAIEALQAGVVEGALAKYGVPLVPQAPEGNSLRWLLPLVWVDRDGDARLDLGVDGEAACAPSTEIDEESYLFSRIEVGATGRLDAFVLQRRSLDANGRAAEPRSVSTDPAPVFNLRFP